jgi:NTP pyrophosphatase (non-canonical NTP hydrolase)
VWKIAEEKGWHEGEELSFGEFIALCHSELSEALEVFRVLGGNGIAKICPHKMDNVEKAPMGIPIELADVIMRILDYCETTGIDIEQAIKTKMIFNRTREHRHGNKVI